MTEIRQLERDIPFSTNGTTGGVDAMVLRWLVANSGLMSGLWYDGRDRDLRVFLACNDYAQIATFNFVSKAITVPLSILPVDQSVKAHQAQAKQIERDIIRNSGIMRGFMNEFSKFTQDYVTQDNGAFMLLGGGGKANGPIMGQTTLVMHLDATRCYRTDDNEFPVTYEHTDGKRYALHYTRVIFMSSLPSPDVTLHDVGKCAMSRCLNSLQNLQDIAQYTQEKLGSRPARQILYAQTGATLEQLTSAALAANSKMDAQGLDRFSRTLMLAPRVATQELKLGLLDLASTPDGFNRKDDTMLDVAVIAAAYGLDMRDLAHAFGVSGQTRADAEVQNLKTQGKGVAEFLTTFAEQFNTKVLSKDFYAEFDYVDDSADEAAANIRRTRSEARERDLRSGVTTVRVEREQMLVDGELTEAQFAEMELEDGRLPDGLDVLMLYQSQDGEISRILSLGVDDPLNIEVNDGAAILAAIHEQTKAAWLRHDNAPNANIRRKMRQALAALDKLRGMYEIKPAQDALQEQQPPEQQPVTAPMPPDQQVEQPPAVKEALLKQEAALDEIEAEYQQQFEALVTQAVNGEIDRNEFVDALSQLVAAMLVAAFMRGGELDEMSVDMATRLQVIIDQNLASVEDFADDIYTGRYAPDELGLASAIGRIALWVGVLGSVYARGQTERKDDPFFEWVWNPLKDHCEDCQRLNGQVHRGSEWRASGWVPQGQMLACHGYRCGCAFMPASGPARGNF